MAGVAHFCKFCDVTPAFALSTATKGNAKIASLGDTLGTIEAGKCADMIVTRRNPLEGLDALRQLDMVIARGRCFDTPKVKKGENTQLEIVTLAKAGIQTIISNRIFLDDELLSVLLLDDTATSNQKILLFKNAISSLNEDSCKKHFDEMGLPDLKGIFSKGSGRKNYEKSDEVTKILEALKENKWIYEYRDDERNPDRYIVVKNKPKSKEPDVLD